MVSAAPAVTGTSALDLVRLAPVMALTAGSAGVVIGLVDGPVAAQHADLTGARIRDAGAGPDARCAVVEGPACSHGTFVAGILAASRESAAPAICPGCTLLVRPIFREVSGAIPSAHPEHLAEAVIDCVLAGARVINLSVSTGEPSVTAERGLEQALDYAARRGVLAVAAAGNQRTLGGSSITRHPAVIPVVATDRQGRPTDDSNLGGSIGRRGLGAPGDAIESLDPQGGTCLRGGTSSAAPFVTGTIALLWSLFPQASATQLRAAVAGGRPRRAVTPPLLNAEAALTAMLRRR
jgi:subtilisin family serine protease